MHPHLQLFPRWRAESRATTIPAAEPACGNWNNIPFLGDIPVAGGISQEAGNRISQVWARWNIPEAAGILYLAAWLYRCTRERGFCRHRRVGGVPVAGSRRARSALSSEVRASARLRPQTCPHADVPASPTMCERRMWSPRARPRPRRTGPKVGCEAHTMQRVYTCVEVCLLVPPAADVIPS